MLKPILLSACMVLCVLSVPTRADDAKRADIDRILEVATPSKQAIDALLNPILLRIKAQNPGVTEAQWQAVRTDLRSVIMNELYESTGVLEAMRKNYDERFTAEEIREIAAFVGSETGRKHYRAMEAITVEMAASWPKIALQAGVRLQDSIRSTLQRHGIQARW